MPKAEENDAGGIGASGAHLNDELDAMMASMELITLRCPNKNVVENISVADKKIRAEPPIFLFR